MKSLHLPIGREKTSAMFKDKSFGFFSSLVKREFWISESFQSLLAKLVDFATFRLCKAAKSQPKQSDSTRAFSLFMLSMKKSLTIKKTYIPGAFVFNPFQIADDMRIAIADYLVLLLLFLLLHKTFSLDEFVSYDKKKC
jgi:hypothetical protein